MENDLMQRIKAKTEVGEDLRRTLEEITADVNDLNDRLKKAVDERNEFQYRLQKAISEKNITASELSRASGVGKADISNYINGKYMAKADKVMALASALDVDPGWLMTGEEPKTNRYGGILELTSPKTDGGIIALIAAYNKAEEWQKQAVKKILNMKGDE